MLIILSPAKIQKFPIQPYSGMFTQPEFIKDAGELVELMRQLTPSELSQMLDINASLAEQNTDRYFNWHRPFTPANAAPAAFMFDGEVYRGLNASTFSDEELAYAQEHLRLLSGLYGVLRPLDLMQPYRLEVSSSLKNPKGTNLYDFWREKMTHSVLKALKNSGDPRIILNLASSEYFKALDLKNTRAKVIDVEFYEYKNDVFKQIVIYTKKARGMMARFVIQNRIESLEDLKGFDKEGYWYSPQMSTEKKMVFVR